MRGSPSRRTLVAMSLAILIMNAAPGPAPADPSPLIPRAALFAGAEHDAVSISPDGRWIAGPAPSPDGVTNIWIAPEAGGERRMVTVARRPIGGYLWAFDSRHLLYASDDNGNEDYHLHAAPIDGGAVRDLTPFPGVRAQSVLVAPSRPQEVLVGLNRRDPRVFDMHRVNLVTGEVTPDTRNPGDVIGWTADADLVIRAATAFTAELETVVRVRDGREASWRDLHTIPFEEAPFLGQVNGGSIVVDFSADGRRLVVGTSRGSPTIRLVELDVDTGAEVRELAADPDADPWQDFAASFVLLADPRDRHVQAVAFDLDKPAWRVLDPGVAADFDYLAALDRGVFRVMSQDLAGTRWVVAYLRDDAPAAWYLYERGKGGAAAGAGVTAAPRARFLFHDRPALAAVTLAPMRPVVIPARDGFELRGYLTLPDGGAGTGLPLLLLAHGGPWSRDEWGFDPVTQWLANRGYAVLAVNYRGSTVNVRYMNAGNGRIGTGTDDDLADAVRWAVDRGIADPARVAIMGASFGGYSVLRGLTRHPELYAAGVDIVGPSEMATLMASIPEYWKPVKRRWLARIGDVTRDSTLNRELSPLHHAETIRAPLLIGHGANDPRVKLEQSERIVATVRGRGGEVTFVVYPDEGHGFQRPENIADFNGRVEAFLHRVLGGRLEPWSPVPGSTAELR